MCVCVRRLGLSTRGGDAMFFTTSTRVLAEISCLLKHTVAIQEQLAVT